MAVLFGKLVSLREIANFHEEVSSVHSEMPVGTMPCLKFFILSSTENTK
jgi:hypothetical protein